MKPTLSFSLVIPVWNEAAKIEKDVRATFVFFQKQHWAAELIVVDDGSSDQTTTIVQNLQKEYGSHLKLVAFGQHHGKGHAVRHGLLRSQGNIVAFMDSGGTVPLTFLQAGLQLIQSQKCQIAAGSRFLPQSRITYPMPLRRRVSSFVFRQMVHWLLNLPRSISDPQCGFKLFEGRIARQLAGQAQMDGFLFDLEFFFLAQQAGWKWQEFPIEWRCDRDSRLSLLKNLPSILKDLRQLRKQFVNH